MTRRKFIKQVLKAGAAIIVGVSWLTEKASPRRFIRAVRLGKYPGSLKPLQDVDKQGKWNG
jgi:hypothetical protein